MPGQAYSSGSLTYCQPVVQGTVACCMKHKHIATSEKSPCNPLMGKRPCKQAAKSCEHKVETINFKRNGANKAIDILTYAPSYLSVPAGILHMQGQAAYASSATSRPIHSNTCAKRVNENASCSNRSAWSCQARSCRARSCQARREHTNVCTTLWTLLPTDLPSNPPSIPSIHQHRCNGQLSPAMGLSTVSPNS